MDKFGIYVGLPHWEKWRLLFLVDGQGSFEGQGMNASGIRGYVYTCEAWTDLIV